MTLTEQGGQTLCSSCELLCVVSVLQIYARSELHTGPKYMDLPSIFVSGVESHQSLKL